MLLQQGSRSSSHLNRFIYSLHTAMSSVTGNHAMDLFYLLKGSFPFWLINHEKELWEFWRIGTNVLRDIESDFVWSEVSGVVSQYILWSGSLWHTLSSSMLKNKRLFSLVISKLMSVFSLWLYNLVWPTIISTNASSKKNSRNLKGVTISPSLLNFGTFGN